MPVSCTKASVVQDLRDLENDSRLARDYARAQAYQDAIELLKKSCITLAVQIMHRLAVTQSPFGHDDDYEVDAYTSAMSAAINRCQPLIARLKK